VIIYQITHRASGRRYVGRTKQTLRARWQKHVWKALHTESEIHLWTAIRRDGPAAFDTCVLQECATVEEMIRAEYEHIERLKREGVLLFNETCGGNGSLGFKHSVRGRQRIQASALARYASGAAHPRATPCVIDGVRYVSRAEAARALNVDRHVAERWARTGIGRRLPVRADRSHGWVPSHEVRRIA